MRICVINTGGTISCVGEPLAPMPSARFADAARQVLGPAGGRFFSVLRPAES